MVRAAMTAVQGGRAGRQRQTAGWLRERVMVVEAECRAVRAERDQLAGQVGRLTGETRRLQARVRELEAKVEELRRAGKRQAAPFSRDRPSPHPGRPGRKPGAAYGQRGRRPAPERVDRVVAVGLPEVCPHCGGALGVERIACQWEEALPVARPSEICRYEVTIGRCQGCHRRIQPRHREQTSDALGAAAVQLGPRVVAPDETSWRVAGWRAWLWAFVGLQITVYRIAHGRGYNDAAAVLGEGYAGVLERDGWAPYRRFTHAVHQTCVAHLLRRVGELLADAKRGQAKTPHAIRRILQQALAVRAARDAGQLTPTQAAAEAERLGGAVDKLVAGQTVYAPNRKLLDHLGRERQALFTFLVHQGVEATNWRAEQAIRPAVVCRKQWGGNATWDGAACWQVLASVIGTPRLQQRDPVALLVGLLRAPGPIVADLAIPGLARGRRSPPARTPRRADRQPPHRAPSPHPVTHYLRTSRSRSRSVLMRPRASAA